MANRKISDLTALTAPATGDLLPIVDISEAAAADKNKKITYGELLASAPAGSAAAPSFSFDGDPNSGLYSAGADQVAISSNGTGRLFVDASGRVGVGGASAAGLLQLKYATDVNTSFRNATAGGLSAGTLIESVNDAYSSYNPIYLKGSLFAFGTDSAGSFSERLRITSAGLVGVGSSSPQALCHVYGGASSNTLPANAQAIFEYSANGGIAISVPAGNAAGVYFPRSTDAYYAGIERNGTDLTFRNNGSTKATLDSSGRLGIGNSSPGANLDIYTSASRYVRAFPSSGLADFEVLSNNNVQPVFAIKGTGTADLFRAFANTTQAVTINSAGRVGIGTTSVSRLLHISAASGDTAARIQTATSGAFLSSKILQLLREGSL